MTTLSTYVLDAATGTPATRLRITLHGAEGELAHGKTESDGKFRFEVDLAPGPYALEFGTARWFAADHRPTFYPAVHIMFTIEPHEEHCHIELLLSPYSYTTSRGSL